MSIEVGAKRKEPSVGGVESLFDVTVNFVGNPRASSPVESRARVFPAASARKAFPTVQAPGSLNCGKVTFADPLADVVGVRLTAPCSVEEPEGLTKET